MFSQLSCIFPPISSIQLKFPKFASSEIHQLLKSKKMISILAQERLLGAALGSTLTAIAVFENRRNIYRSISENNAKFGDQSQIMKPVFEKKPCFDIAHLWNKAVDKTFGTVIASVSSRGW